MSILWDDEETDDFEELLYIKFCCESNRYFNLREYTKNKNGSIHDCLFEFSDKDFKQSVRMKKRSFIRLVNMIKRHKYY